MIWRIDIVPKVELPSNALCAQIKDLGIRKDCSVCARSVFLIEAGDNQENIEKIASTLLVDPCLENYRVTRGIFPQPPSNDEILVTLNPGVFDTVATSMEKAIKDLSLDIKSGRTARFYKFQGLEYDEIRSLAEKLLFNPLIEHLLEYEKVKELDTLDEFSGHRYTFSLKTVDILDADDKKLLKFSQDGCLSLSAPEMKIIQGYFKARKRNPTDCELETIATLWSEHCGHKTFRGVIDYEERDEKRKLVKKATIDSLLKSTVMKATKELKHPRCVSVFDDNSGVVKFDKDFNICFKVETHNHPSSLEPYGGASTGIGGVIRDIVGTGCAAKPFASVDIFCFSPWHISYEALPKGLLHPKRVIKGVIKGVRDYGNRMGIPTVAGAVLFDERFLGNPLVYCGTLGLLPKGKSFKKVHKGDLVILCGAKTGRDGIHGATFSSKELDEQTVGLTSAVQIGNAIEEKKLTEAILRSRDKNLFTAITDCGAGGISSAVTEIAQDWGVEVALDKVPLKYRGLSYTDIWISESQERMVFLTQQKHLKALKEIFNEEDVELAVIGTVTDTHTLVLSYEGTKVCELDMDFIFHLPKLKKQALWTAPKQEKVTFQEKSNYSDDLKNLLASLNVACKDWVLREYDHEVQAGSVVKSISGIENVCVADGSVVRPDLKNRKCVAIGLGINPYYSDIDPYHMASLAIEEALRNVVCVGGTLRETYILDNFCWGSPQDKEILGSLVRASLGCYDFAKYFKVPFISGKDSLYNEYTVGNKRIAIPGTLLISAMSVVEDWNSVSTANLKAPGNLLYNVGMTKNELGASEYFRMLKVKKGAVPKIDRKISRKILEATSNAIHSRIVCSCHDVSEGGLAVACAEMCIGSDLGAHIFLDEVPHDRNMRGYEVLFSESPSRFIVEVEKKNKEKFERQYKGLPFGLIGCVSADKNLVVQGKDNKEIVNAPIEELRESWFSPFQEFR
ncbi:MAG: phosphoribosylformylglycinamidine synthase subunit PurL [Candidatus Omnitrophica bacterium]|nr:phosphoribosylformylglycinamidine synthase subunit PurL [Candidatus Omnitrophota bacterium]